ncbi:hypothetical protein BDZ91DRAFT_728556 [Kalaharituber pfeilii]|nr:hypothetical protein BDZ91DRAFT_728556 [Kalaharituber pfeilii]
MEEAGDRLAQAIETLASSSGTGTEERLKELEEQIKREANERLEDRKKQAEDNAFIKNMLVELLARQSGGSTN